MKKTTTTCPFSGHELICLSIAVDTYTAQAMNILPPGAYKELLTIREKITKLIKETN